MYEVRKFSDIDKRWWKTQEYQCPACHLYYKMLLNKNCPPCEVKVIEARWLRTVKQLRRIYVFK